MGSRALQCFSIFLLHLFLIPDSSFSEKPPLEAPQKNRKLETQERQILSSSPSLFTPQKDVPIINPTTPGTTSPTANPVMSPPSPPSPTMTGPTITQPAPATTTSPAPTGGAWCMANPSASETALQVALDYACGFGGADCSPLQPGAICYNPNSVRDHASYAFNDYYHKNPAPTSCVFGGTAQLTYTDPSKGNCRFPSTSGSTSTTPVNPPPTMPTPTITTPTITTPMTPGIPMTPSITTPDTVYGAAEPTGLPSSATSVSCSLLLIFTVVTAFLGSLVDEYYL